MDLQGNGANRFSVCRSPLGSEVEGFNPRQALSLFPVANRDIFRLPTDEFVQSRMMTQRQANSRASQDPASKTEAGAPSVFLWFAKVEQNPFRIDGNREEFDSTLSGPPTPTLFEEYFLASRTSERSVAVVFCRRPCSIGITT